MVGYSLMGYILFGIADEKFLTVSRSLMTLFLMIIGNVSIFDIVTTGVFLSYLFGATFMLINVLLMNMLVAIYASHCIQYYTDQEIINVNEGYLIIKMLE